MTERLVAKHADDQVLVIGQYLDQLAELAEHLDAPLITGATTVRERQRLFGAFRTGEVSRLVVSKVANFSIDLPEAAVAIQVSGSFGSRQEEAQRLGRIMRPKADGEAGCHEGAERAGQQGRQGRQGHTVILDPRRPRPQRIRCAFAQVAPRFRPGLLRR